MQLRAALLLWLPSLAGCSAYLPFDDLATEGGGPGKTPCAWELSAETRYPSSGRPFALDVADFDGNGASDVVLVANEAFGDIQYASIEIQLNRGDRNFEDWYNASKNSAPGGSMITRGIAAGDIDQDGNADVVQSFASFDSDSGSFDRSVGIGNGRLEWDGIWTVAKPDDAALGDFDGDGWLDAAVLQLTDDAGYADEKLLLFWSDGQGSFELPVEYAPSGVFSKTLREMTVADLNADQRADIALSSWGNGAVQVLLGTADRGMIQLAEVPVGTAPWGIAAADFDGDGPLDLAVVNDNDFTVSILHGVGDGNFDGETPITVGKDMQPLVAVDLDQDGDADLAIGGQQEIFTLRNDGGVFAEPESHPMDGTPGRFASADFDLDGLPDLALSNLSRNSFSVFWGQCVN